MATTQLSVESKNTEFDSQGAKIMEMRLIAQNKNAASITNPNDKRTEPIKAPFSEIVKTEAEGNLGDLII